MLINIFCCPLQPYTLLMYRQTDTYRKYLMDPEAHSHHLPSPGFSLRGKSADLQHWSRNQRQSCLGRRTGHPLESWKHGRGEVRVVVVADAEDAAGDGRQDGKS